MKGMATAREFYQAPPPGRYRSKIVAAESTISKKSGASMIKLTLEVREPEEYASAQATDYLITDGSANGAGMAKTKLRGLGIDVDNNVEIPDDQICSNLIGQELWVDYDNEAMTTKESGYTAPKVFIEDGKQITQMKLTVKAYYRHNVGLAQTAPVQGLNVQGPAPVQQVQAPVQQFAPQGFVPQMPHQMAQQMPQQQLPQQQYAGAVVPQQFAPQMPQQQMPQQFAPQQMPVQQQQVPVQQFVPQMQAQQQAPVNGGPSGSTPPWAQGQSAEPKKAGRGKKQAEE